MFMQVLDLRINVATTSILFDVKWYTCLWRCRLWQNKSRKTVWRTWREVSWSRPSRWNMLIWKRTATIMLTNSKKTSVNVLLVIKIVLKIRIMIKVMRSDRTEPIFRSKPSLKKPNWQKPGMHGFSYDPKLFKKQSPTSKVKNKPGWGKTSVAPTGNPSDVFGVEFRDRDLRVCTGAS